MIKCKLFGHKRVHLGKPFKDTGPDHSTFVIDHCDKCWKVVGVWVWYHKNWSYFKR
jgi:hypothetical protein